MTDTAPITPLDNSTTLESQPDNLGIAQPNASPEQSATTRQENSSTNAEFPNFSVPTKKSVETTTTPEEFNQNLSQEPTVTNCSISLQILDYHGWPIPNLSFRVLDISNKPARDIKPSDPANTGIKLILEAKTDAAGNAPTLNGLKIDTRLEFQIKNDQGIYRLAAIDTVKGAEGNACLRSPKDKFTFTTYAHEGNPGSADKNRLERAKKHKQVAEKEHNVSRNTPIKPEAIAVERNDKGNPIVAIKDGLANMWGQNKNTATAPNVGKTDLEKVNKLIEFATAQTFRRDSGATSAAIIDKMKKGTYEDGGAKQSEGYQNSIHHCAKYVKIALWHAGYSTTEDGDIDSKAGLARQLGPGLLRNGFKDVTDKLPDARWAAPGDIIVYERKGAPDAAGHIDIRTYDGYISDYIGRALPVRQFNVIGIYRKYYDPMPEKRIRAFLKVIREWECHGIEDGKRYFRLQNSLNGSMYFSDTSAHPYANQPNTRGSFSGAYQIKYSTWSDQVTKYDLPANFTPKTQDMMAVSLIEYRKALGYIRKGEIAEAITSTFLTSEWSSLPNGQHGRQERRGKDIYFYSVDDVVQRYNEFLKEL